MMQNAASNQTIISVDAMGGDRGPEAIVAGLSLLAKRDPDLRYILHGDKARLSKLVTKCKGLADLVEIRHADGVVTMDDKPSQVMRKGQDTSMWSTIEAVRDGDARVAVSCGNTGALMALSMIRLRKLPGVSRPAIACLWPSRNPGGFNIMLDVGADVKADETNLLQFALMGSSYARNGLGLKRPRVGLLNVGTEEHKGRAELKAAFELITDAADSADYDFVGFVEGSDIPSSKVDVIVTDGFTGNVALKTAEGTASLIKDFLRDSFMVSPLSKFTALLARGSLNRLASRMDPRQVNGGVFLGLNGTVVKSHGGADATGVAAAVGLAADLARSDFTQRLASRVALAHVPGDSEVAKDQPNSRPAE